MENQQNKTEQEEIINPAQFKVGRAPEDEKSIDQDDSEYTEEEIEFADGEGTQLEEEFDVPRDKKEKDDDLDDDFEDSDDN